MKKIILYFYLCFIIGCSGYQPLLSTNNLKFYVNDVENIGNNKITKNLIKKIKHLRLKNEKKREFNLKINSKKKLVIASKDAKGDPLIYKMIITTNLDVYENDEKIGKIYLKEDFSFKNNSDNFNLSQYKMNIEENLINKTSEELVLKLQTM
ncbi:hypothetical protein OAS96_02075 [Candidatus Pelagibacter sp.]|nr:hypothetical protein [Candidatus Pelagibacter sp.]